LSRSAARPRTAGQSLVEFAIFVPVLALVLLMAVDFGRVYLGWVELTNVARIGANYAAQHPDAWDGTGDSAIQLRYRQLMARDAQGINCTLPSSLPAPGFVDGTYTVGSRVSVSINCAFQLITPLLSNLIGDGAGNVTVSSSALFTVRFGSPDTGVIGGDAPTPSPTAEPTSAPTPSPTPDPGPTATPDPSATATPTPGPTSSADPVVVSFYGIPTSSDSYGGGPPGSEDEEQIVGVPTTTITFYNTTVGDQGLCRWEWGDGSDTTNACSGTVSHSYLNRGTYTVTLNVDTHSATRTDYVLVGCKVPAFAGVHVGSAVTKWQNAGFTWSNLFTQDGNGNYKIGYQSLAGGLVNPPGGCAGATITVGP
jgi:Flp pilus assembly protein TadG